VVQVNVASHLSLSSSNVLYLLSLTAFRFTSVFPPEPHLLANEKIESLRLGKFLPSCIQALEVMIQVWLNAPVVLSVLVFLQTIEELILLPFTAGRFWELANG